MNKLTIIKTVHTVIWVFFNVVTTYSLFTTHYSQLTTN